MSPLRDHFRGKPIRRGGAARELARGEGGLARAFSRREPRGSRTARGFFLTRPKCGNNGNALKCSSEMIRQNARSQIGGGDCNSSRAVLLPHLDLVYPPPRRLRKRRVSAGVVCSQNADCLRVLLIAVGCGDHANCANRKNRAVSCSRARESVRHRRRRSGEAARSLPAGFFVLLAAGLGVAVLFLCGCVAASGGFAYNTLSHRR